MKFRSVRLLQYNSQKNRSAKGGGGGENPSIKSETPKTQVRQTSGEGIFYETSVSVLCAFLFSCTKLTSPPEAITPH